MTVTVTLLLIFAAAIGYATFVENSRGTEIARAWVYDAIWFEILFVLLTINMIGSLVVYGIFNRRKFSVLLIHLSFIVIVIGAGITRFLGKEGMMHIREGETTNEISSDELILKIVARQDGKEVVFTDAIQFGPTQRNELKTSLQIGEKKFEIQTEAFIPNVRETIVPAENGQAAIALFVMNAQQEGQDFILQQVDSLRIDEMAFRFNTQPANLPPDGIEFFWQQDRLMFRSSEPVLIAPMMQDSEPDQLEAASVNPVVERTIYRISGYTFVVKSYLKNAARSLVQLDDPHQSNTVVQIPHNAVVFHVSDGLNSQRVNLLLSDEVIVSTASCQLNKTAIEISYGFINQHLPFNIKLNDFIMERYPGSNSPSSYSSQILITDLEKNLQIPYLIYMNNILNYRGYRFFQTSYDQDEKGTVLSVNKDFWGTTISYIGYGMLLLGILLNFFNKNSRFRTLIQQSSELQTQRRKSRTLVIVLVWMASSVGLSAQSYENYLSELNTLLVQDEVQGRIEPFCTFANDVLRKINKSGTFNDRPASVIIMSMIANPEQWQNEPVIAVKHSGLAKELGAINGKIAFNQLFDFEQGGTYRLSAKVDGAYLKEVNERTRYDKEVIQLDERVNICYQLFEGNLPRLFPTHDQEGAWLVPDQLTNDQPESFTYSEYLQLVATAIRTDNWHQAIAPLKLLKQYQLATAKELPSPTKLKLEVFYNNANIFGQLSYWLMAIGFLYLLICLWDIFYVTKQIARLEKVAVGVFALVFMVYSAGLVLRWYISEHAPWSNGYETMLFVGWATLFSGMLVARKSPVALATTGILAGIALMVAGMSWMNPEITNLVPVLKSYWLIIHVAVITSSYGFLAMASLLGLLNLLLMISRGRVINRAKKERITASTTELSLIIELAMMIGLLLLTIGCFIGGVWANESWGRYWGWDPKETWALVSVLVYTVILHFRNIHQLNNQLVLSSGALLGFSSIIMTFFGVNYYLSGMHSYGQGTPPPIPVVVYFILPVLALIIYGAYRAEKSLSHAKN